MKKILFGTTGRLLLSVVLGILIGYVAPESVMTAIVAIKHILGQLIFFLVPLIIVGFITPSITKLKHNASKLLSISLFIAYVSSVGSALFAVLVGYETIPYLDIAPVTEGLREAPKLLFQLDIPPIMSVMSALVISLMLGLAVVWVKSDKIEGFFIDFQKIVFELVNRILIPILPFFIAANFSILSYEGTIETQLPVFLIVVLISIACHIIWLALLYGLAGLYSKKNPWRVLKHYGPTAVTAMGTQSSAASLGLAIKAAKKSDALKDDVTDFSIPLFSNIHFCGSVLAVVFFVIAISQVLYGSLPSFSDMSIFVLLLGVLAIGAPGLPGGTVMASLGLLSAVLGFDEAGTALLLTIFALQDSFGTAANITSDGALSLFLTSYSEKKGLHAAPIDAVE